MEHRIRASIATCVVALAVASIATTAPAQTCPSVKSGFTGNVNDTYVNDYGGNGDSGGPGGSDSGGDAGAGDGGDDAGILAILEEAVGGGGVGEIG